MVHEIFEGILPRLAQDLNIYLKFILKYLVLFLPCFLGAAAANRLKRLRGIKVAPGTERIVLSSSVTTILVVLLDYFAIPESGRLNGISIGVAFIGGVLSHNLITMLLNYTTAIEFCKAILSSTAFNKVVESVVSVKSVEDKGEVKEIEAESKEKNNDS